MRRTTALEEVRNQAATLVGEVPVLPANWSVSKRRRFQAGWLVLVEHVVRGRTLAGIAREMGTYRSVPHQVAKWTAVRWLEIQTGDAGSNIPESVDYESALAILRKHPAALTVDCPEPLPSWSTAARVRFRRGWGMLARHVVDGCTLAAIGQELGISRQRVHNIANWTAYRWFELSGSQSANPR